MSVYTKVLLLIALWVLFSTSIVTAEDYYVDVATGNDSNSGLSWGEAKASICGALTLVDGDDNIFVAQGTYNEKPQFPGANNIGLYGGYNAPDSNQDPTTYETIIDGNGLVDGPVIQIPGNDGAGFSGLVIDGFTITRGSGPYCGGIYSESAGVTVSRCRIVANIAHQSNGYAGAFYLYAGAEDEGSVNINSCVIMNNSACGVGGILLTGDTDRDSSYYAFITNCVICENNSTGISDYEWNWGTGGVDIFYPAYAFIKNCTIANNSSEHPFESAAGIHVSGISPNKGQLDIANTIIWHPDGNDLVVTNMGISNMAYCNIEDSETGTNVLHVEPGFDVYNEYCLCASSNCIDTGCNAYAPAVDILGTARPIGEAVDIGAYELDPNMPAALISDNFNDNAQDGLLWQKWLDDANNFWCSETNERLEVLSGGDTNDICRSALYLSSGWLLDVSEDFSFKIDYHHSANTFNDSGVILGLSCDSLMPKSKYIRIGAGCDENTPYFDYELVDELDPNGSNDWISRAGNDGGLYISYDAGADELYLSYAGYGNSNAWQTIAGVLQGNWGGKPLYVVLGGYCQDVALDSGEAYADNFALETGMIVTEILHCSATPDFDGDGKTDLILSDQMSQKCVGTLMDGLYKVQNKGLGGSETWRIVGIGNFDGNSTTDILWRENTSGIYLGTLMDGLVKIENQNLSGSYEWNIIALPDFDGDGKSDILWHEKSTGKYVAMLMDGLNKGLSKGLGTSTIWQIIAMPDLDGDGKSDIIWHEKSSGKYVATLMDGLNKGLSRGLGTSEVWQIVGLADFDGDGKSDILWRDNSTGRYAGTVMNGLYKGATKGLGGSSLWKIAGLADFDGNGKTDILWQGTETGEYLGTLMDGLTKIENAGLGGSDYDKIIALPDLDGDGKTDIIWHESSRGTYTATVMDGLLAGQSRDIGTSYPWQITLPECLIPVTK
jgi:hypothetical protein